MRFYWFLLGTLAVWRVTHLLALEAGPWDVLDHLRSRLGSNFLGGLFDCFYCLSLWVAIGFALVLAGTWKTALLICPAFSGGAILLERITSRAETEDAESPVVYFEDQEENDDVLRQKEFTPTNQYS